MPKIRLETSSIQSALCFASNDLGITFAPESYIPLFNAQKELAYFYLEKNFSPQPQPPPPPPPPFFQKNTRPFKKKTPPPHAGEGVLAYLRRSSLLRGVPNTRP